MCQPRLMKLSRNNICRNCLSYDVVSITFTYFLSTAYTSPKYGIQFFSIDTPQNLLQASEKLVLASQLNPFEFFFDCRKQVEVTRGQIRWTRWAWHAENTVFFKPICWSPTCVNRAIVDMNHKSFLMLRPSLRKDRLFDKTSIFVTK
jgi:hypothetical protein